MAAVTMTLNEVGKGWNEERMKGTTAPNDFDIDLDHDLK
jgi:hypothetical protein